MAGTFLPVCLVVFFSGKSSNFCQDAVADATSEHGMSVAVAGS